MLIFVGSMFTSIPLASAIQTDELKKGDGIALVVKGNGEIMCGNGNQFSSVDLFILLSEDANEKSNFGGSGMGLTKENSRLASELNFANLDSQGFEVKGVILVDEICDEESISITASGKCGLDSTVSVETSRGSQSTFQAKVSCI